MPTSTRRVPDRLVETDGPEGPPDRLVETDGPEGPPAPPHRQVTGPGRTGAARALGTAVRFER